MRRHLWVVKLDRIELSLHGDWKNLAGKGKVSGYYHWVTFFSFTQRAYASGKAAL
jgi:hypothetical protein